MLSSLPYSQSSSYYLTDKIDQLTINVLRVKYILISINFSVINHYVRAKQFRLPLPLFPLVGPESLRASLSLPTIWQLRLTLAHTRTGDHNWTQPICNCSDLKVVVTMYVFPHEFLLLWSAFVCDVGYISIVTQYLVWASESPYQWVFPFPNSSFLTAQ